MTFEGAPAPRISLLGGFELRLQQDAVELPPSAQRLLSFLALKRGTLTRGYIAGNLWADSDEVQASSSLRSTLWRLRERAQLIEKTNTHMALASWVKTDVDEMTHVSRRLVEGDAPPDAGEVFGLIHSGELLPGWYDDWLIVEREQVRQRRLHMLEVACRPSSPVNFGPFEAVAKSGAGVPVAGHARCCCERACQSPD